MAYARCGQPRREGRRSRSGSGPKSLFPPVWPAGRRIPQHRYYRGWRV